MATIRLAGDAPIDSPPIAAAAGDFESLLRASERPVRQFLASIGVAAADVDDVAQETFLEYHRHGAARPAAVEPLRWLLGIARHKALDHFRRRTRLAAHERLVQALERATPPFAGERGDDVLEALRGCLARLSDADRGLLADYYGQQAAAARGSSAIRMAVLRLREALRRCVRGGGPEGAP